ncbi:hypothetical protein [Streptomyces pseudovenezuelae]|uniref:hypothetical protein n=1 Tax=Streptomyces pseudovenezuelae TaxID=67350 RepID=UPI0036E57D11
MSARTVIAHALRVYYSDAPDPNGFVEKLLANYDSELLAAHGIAGEKDTRGGSPRQGESTHRHTRPCEFPAVLPCTCPRPGALPEASFVRARRRARIAVFFRGAGAARTRAWAVAS